MTSQRQVQFHHWLSAKYRASLPQPQVATRTHALKHLGLMRNILEYSADFLLTTLLSQKQVLDGFHTLINEMVPRTRITI